MNEDNTGEQNFEEAAAPVEPGYETQESEQSHEAHNVPLDALQQERAQRQQLQEELRMMKDHMALMQSQFQQPKPQEPQESLSDDDVMTYGEFKKALQQKERQYQTNIEELRMTQKHPDYQEVITKYLPDVLKSNPSLRRSLEQSQDYELAYYLAKNSEAYKATNKKAKKNEAAERILQNTQSDGSLSSVGRSSPTNSAKSWKSMSDEEFMRQVQRNMGYA